MHDQRFFQGDKDMFCTTCGKPLPDYAFFCPACGAKVKGLAKPEESALHSLRCASCGSSSLRKIRAGEYLCEHCGTKLYTGEQMSDGDVEKHEAEAAALLSEAQGYAEKKDYRNELRTLAKAMEIAPENNTVLLRLGRAYWRAGLPEKALEYYHIAEELYPKDPIVYANIGSAYLKLGHNEKAKEQYEKAISMIEADPMSACADDIAITYGNYALCVGRLGDRNTAKKYLSIAKEKGYSKDSIDTICGELHLLRFLL